MRKLLSKTFIFLGVLSLVLGTFNIVGQSISYAEDLELRGTNLGLEIIPTTSKLFDLQNLNPGDSKEGKITIKNNYVAPFNLYMRAERMSPYLLPEEADLFEQMILTVKLRGNTVYSGPMKDFATSNIFLGSFDPNDIEELVATMNLPGPETGNEYQGKSVDVKWIFIATSEGPPDPPNPPGPPGPPDPPDTDPPDDTPEEPEEVEILEEEIPQGVPEEPEEVEIMEEEVPQGTPEESEEVEILEEETPLGIPKLPKTGEISPMIFYGTGMLFILMGTKLGFRKKK